MTINKSEIKQITMKSLKKNNFNPQKQSQPNILGYFNGPKLYKRQNNHSPLHSSRQKKNPKSPKQTKINQQRYQLKNVTPPLTARNADISLKNRNSQEQYISGSYTTRIKQINSQDNTSDLSNKGLTSIKKQINSAERKRFYYKQEYDQHDKDECQHQQVQQKSQYRTILPQYFSKINIRGSRRQYDDFQEKSRNREKRSLSPLEESQQKLFQKCYKETSSHLQLMLKEIRESKEKLDCIHEEILENVHEAVKIRSFSLRSQIIDMVQNILDQWENNEWQFIKNNEISFIDDLLQLKEQLNEREIKVNQLMQKLEKQRSSSWLQKMNQIQFFQNIQKSETIWKSVTTDLLMFNYEHSIMEIQELSDKISISIPQRCDQAINTLFPSQFNQKIQFRTSNTSNFVHLKSIILKIISQIACYSHNHSSKHYIQSSKTPKNNLQPYYLPKQTKPRNYQY